MSRHPLFSQLAIMTVAYALLTDTLAGVVCIAVLVLLAGLAGVLKSLLGGGVQS